MQRNEVNGVDKRQENDPMDKMDQLRSMIREEL